MAASQFCLRWESYENNVCHGLSRLQQREEFVDMTLAADGHLVKVHQNILALASSYLSELLKSIPCQHPVIFLNNISCEVLNFILEYIYTGEVQVPAEKLHSFIDAAKALHIKGVAHVLPSKNKSVIIEESNESTTKSNVEQHPRSDVAANITIKNKDIEVTKFVNKDNEHELLVVDANDNDPLVDVDNDWHIEMELQPSTSDQGIDIHGNVPQEIKEQKSNTSPNVKTEVQYTVSNKGSLQIIVNRFVYNAHHQASGGKKRRWRCVDYRKLRCKAYIDTDGEVITNRQFTHCHPFHDNKIIKKLKGNLVFTSLQYALNEVIKINSISKGNEHNKVCVESDTKTVFHSDAEYKSGCLDN